MDSNRVGRKQRARDKAKQLKARLPTVDGFRPDPNELGQEILSVDDYKSLDCPCYDDCLWVASVADWRGLSCRGCPVFRKEKQEYSRIVCRVFWRKLLKVKRK